MSVSGDDVTLDFSLTDGARVRYTISSEGPDAPPKFEMIDGTGQVVLSGDFEYG